MVIVRKFFTGLGLLFCCAHANAQTPSAPSNLLVDATYGSNSPQVVLTWTDNNDTETGHEIDRATDAGFSSNLQTFTLTEANTGTTASYTDNSVTDGTLYFYHVRAMIDANPSSYSSYRTAVPVVEAGNAASFDNSSEFVGVPPSIQTRTEWTFTCWFKGNGRIYSEGAPAALFTMDTYSSWSFVQIQAYNSSDGPWAHVKTPGVKNQDDWNFLAISVSDADDYGSTAIVILNDAVKYESLHKVKYGSAVSYACFGKNVGSAYGGQPASEFTGEIDEAATWSRALTEEEMFAIRDSGIAADSEDLIGLWHFDEPNSSTTIYDYSGNDNHGTRTNSPQQVSSEALSPFSPQSFSVIPTDGQAELTWDESVVSDFETYNISYKLNSGSTYSTIAIDNQNSTSHILADLSNGDIYDFKISVTDLAQQTGPESEVHQVPNFGPGNAIEFDGTDGVLTIADNKIFERGTGLTLEAWIFPDVLNNSTQFLVGVEDAFGLRVNDLNQVEFFTNNGSVSTIGSDASGLLSEDKWHHVALTFQETTASLYLNGLLISQHTSASVPQASSMAFTVGATASGSQYFDGYVDEVRLWDQGIEQSTLADVMYERQRGDEIDVGINSANLIGLWHFDEPDGNTTYSTPENAYNGTMSGTYNIVSSSALTISGVIARDYDALLDLYDETGGEHWTINTNWLGTSDVNNWHGVTVDDHRVSALALASNNLSGSIPESISDLTYCLSFDLDDNLLTGELQPAFSDIDKMQTLSVANNELVSIPDLSSLSALAELNVSHNYLEFDDLEQNAEISNFDYAPQNEISTTDVIDLDEGEELNLSITVGGSENNYQWYVDDIAINNASNMTYTKSNITTDDEGIYHVEITNSLLPALTLLSSDISVTVNCTKSIWYADHDNDDFGDESSTMEACTQPEGYVSDNTDCDDSDHTVYPGAPDPFPHGGKDRNCDGFILGSDKNYNDLIIYPNPAYDLLTISFPTLSKKSYEPTGVIVYDLSGQAQNISISSMEDSTLILNVKNLANGIYLGKLLGEQGDQFVFRFSKE